VRERERGTTGDDKKVRRKRIEAGDESSAHQFVPMKTNRGWDQLVDLIPDRFRLQAREKRRCEDSQD
jgi:hypothetical protein